MFTINIFAYDECRDMRASRHFLGVKIISENIGISSKYRKIIGTLKNIGMLGALSVTKLNSLTLLKIAFLK